MHGFEKSGREDLFFLMAATLLPPSVEEMAYHQQGCSWSRRKTTIC